MIQLSMLKRILAGLTVATLAGASCMVDQAPDFGTAPVGPGARVRYDLGNRPLPAIPLPNDTATWPDPTSRTGLRINASLIAPTTIERQARQRFSQMEGWGTYAPLSVSFDVLRCDPNAEHNDPNCYTAYDGPALNLDNLR